MIDDDVEPPMDDEEPGPEPFRSEPDDRKPRADPFRSERDDELREQNRREISGELRRPGNPRDFSEGAVRELLARNRRIFLETAREAIRLGRKEGLDTVSARHVREAAHLVFARRDSTAQRTSLAIGGLAGGAGAQNLLDLISGPASAITPQEMITTLLLMMTGTAATVFGVIRRGRP
ncbi:hypothetical protein [Actinoplanes sp. NPDC051851]|uniref:hypothetical protein n=1 Tax=Actinoplanes sp. NPDC051851 TaxID=3154753 RepID=UPI00343B46E0